MSNSKIQQATSLQEFQNSQFGTVRTVQVNNQPYFVGRDVAIALGYSNPVSAISQHVDSEDSAKHAIPDNQGFMQQTTIINESGLYALVFGSKLPAAKQFKRWVTSEVLPSIRQTGGYIATSQEDTPELIMARALQVAQSTIERHQQQLQILEGQNELQQSQIKALAPKAQYTDKVLNAVNTYTSTQMAKDLDLRTADQLHRLLKGWGVMMRQSGQWLLSAKYCGQGYTKTRTHSYTRQDGTQGTNSITVWTERGRWFLHQLMAKKGGVQ